MWSVIHRETNRQGSSRVPEPDIDTMTRWKQSYEYTTLPFPVSRLRFLCRVQEAKSRGLYLFYSGGLLGCRIAMRSHAVGIEYDEPTLYPTKLTITDMFVYSQPLIYALKSTQGSPNS